MFLWITSWVRIKLCWTNFSFLLLKFCPVRGQTLVPHWEVTISPCERVLPIEWNFPRCVPVKPSLQFPRISRRSRKNLLSHVWVMCRKRDQGKTMPLLTQKMWRGSFPWAARLKKQLYATLPENPQHTERLSNTTNLISLEYITLSYTINGNVKTNYCF